MGCHSGTWPARAQGREGDATFRKNQSIWRAGQRLWIYKEAFPEKIKYSTGLSILFQWPVEEQGVQNEKEKKGALLVHPIPCRLPYFLSLRAAHTSTEAVILTVSHYHLFVLSVGFWRSCHFVDSTHKASHKESVPKVDCHSGLLGVEWTWLIFPLEMLQGRVHSFFLIICIHKFKYTRFSL